MSGDPTRTTSFSLGPSDADFFRGYQDGEN